MASMLVAYGAAFGEGPSVMAEVLPYAELSAQLRKSSRQPANFHIERERLMLRALTRSDARS